MVVLRLLGLLLVLVDLRDVRDRDVDGLECDAEGGLDADWKGLSSEKGLAPASSDSRFSLASGSSIFTEGSKTACAGALFRDLRVDFSTSPSVSDARGVLAVLLLLGVFVLLDVDGVAATAFAAVSSDLLFLPRGVFGAGGGGINCRSSSSSPSTVPS